MQVSQQDAYANVRLEWQAVNEDDETRSCDSWSHGLSYEAYRTL